MLLSRTRYVRKPRDLLLMLWPIFFVYAVPREPEYGARNFRKIAREASGLVVTFLTSVKIRPKGQRPPTRADNAAKSKHHGRVWPFATVKSADSVTFHQVQRQHRQRRLSRRYHYVKKHVPHGGEGKSPLLYS